MERAKRILHRLLYPSTGVLMAVPVLSFAALIAVFTCSFENHALAYLIYGLSAYSLTIWLAALPRWVRRGRARVRQSRLMRKLSASKWAGRYVNDLAFRGRVSIYQGLAMNLFYVVFRIAAGVRYASVWFLSMAVYYLVLGGLRLYLVCSYRRRSPARERRCYRTTAWLLFLLNDPMGIMIVLMVRTNSGFSYPGYVIYLSALYTFYTMGMSIVQLVKFRRLGSPILSAARVLNFVAAMMSVLGLQTAMIARFSQHGEAFRRTMNTITGGAVYGIVILTAVFMLLKGEKKAVEQV